MDSTTYKVIELPKFGGKLTPSTRQLRDLLPGEILIKVHACTIHPADIFFINGTYGAVKPEVFPLVPGFEGAGEIVKVGPEGDEAMIGKRANVFAIPKVGETFDGLWAEYFIATIDEDIIIYDTKVDFEKLCFGFGNPMTALGFLDTFKKSKAKAVIQNGASSAFGKMFLRLCIKENVEIVNVVRRDIYFKNFKDYGAKHMISTSDRNWSNDLAKLSKELGATIMFDCVGGDFTGKFLSAIPNESTLYHFGNLELKRLGELDTNDLIFKSKNVKGWWLSAWLNSLSKDEYSTYLNYIKNDFSSEKPILGTEYTKCFGLDQIEQAFEQYMSNPSDGKIIIKPNN